MKRTSIPEGFTVACIDGAWYPLEAYRLYSTEYPDGFLCVQTMGTSESDETSFPTQREALEVCQKKDRMNENMKRWDWEMLAQNSNVYPERCAHYISIIEEVTGRPPLLTRGWLNHHVFVFGGYCRECKQTTLCVPTSALTIEDALADAAEQVYATWCQCKQMQTIYQELLTA